MKPPSAGNRKSLLPLRSRRQALLTGLGGLVVLAALAFGATYVIVLGGSAARPLALSSASGTPSTSAAASSAASQSPGPSAGAWTVASGSKGGYRVREQLALLAAPSDASSITGTLTLVQSASGYEVTAASFSVDVSTLTSDRAMRDQRLHVLGLESDRYPTATFTLTSPITLPAAAASGQVVHVSATGDLTIHGTTRSVTIPLDARLNGLEIKAAGSLSFPFSEFNMVPPSIGGFVSVQDNATMEFDLLFRRA